MLVSACGARTSLDDVGSPVVAASLDGGAPAADVPRPVAPLSTSRVTTRRPTLRWILPDGVAGATLDLCVDRPCVLPKLASVHVAGSSYTPPEDLPTGVVYWRLHPESSASTSATWQFIVGARDAPLDSSWGTTLDVNGDGHADVAVGDSAGAAYVYLGGPFDLTPSAVLASPDLGVRVSRAFGESIASAGDVNGDGYADLIVGAPYVGGGTGVGKAYVYLGGPSGIATAPATTLEGLAGNDPGFGWSVSSAGDVNGDGYADLVVGAPDFGLTAAGSIDVYLGGPGGPSSTPAATIVAPGAMGSYFGDSVAAADVDLDGYSDVVVGHGDSSMSGATVQGSGTIYIYAGGAAGTSTSPASVLVGPSGDASFGEFLANVGDVSGDGYPDLAFGSPGASAEHGVAYVWLAGALGFATMPDFTLPNVDFSLSGFGDGIASAGDVDGDGYPDVVIGNLDLQSFSGRTYVYAGGPGGISATPTTILTTPSGTTLFGAPATGAGDVNGDGYSDVVVIGLQQGNENGVLHLFLGGPSGVDTTPDQTIDGPTGTFGSSLAGATN